MVTVFSLSNLTQINFYIALAQQRLTDVFTTGGEAFHLNTLGSSYCAYHIWRDLISAFSPDQQFFRAKAVCSSLRLISLFTDPGLHQSSVFDVITRHRRASLGLLDVSQFLKKNNVTG